MKVYSVNEMFYSLQGEGRRAGTANVFLRFAGCNLQCVVEASGKDPREVEAGFNCDTDFRRGDKMTAEEVVERVVALDKSKAVDNGRRPARVGWVIATGGEPTLQLDTALVARLASAGYSTALETNGTKADLPAGVRWVSCSPKPGSKVLLQQADEVRCVIRPGQQPDAMGVKAKHYFVSPAFHAPTVEALDQLGGWDADEADLAAEALEWAISWCLENPRWRLSVQQHKLWGVR